MSYVELQALFNRIRRQYGMTAVEMFGNRRPGRVEPTRAMARWDFARFATQGGAQAMQIAAFLECDERTVNRWRADWRQHGLLPARRRAGVAMRAA